MNRLCDGLAIMAMRLRACGRAGGGRVTNTLTRPARVSRLYWEYCTRGRAAHALHRSVVLRDAPPHYRHTHNSQLTAHSALTHITSPRDP